MRLSAGRAAFPFPLMGRSAPSLPRPWRSHACFSRADWQFFCFSLPQFWQKIMQSSGSLQLLVSLNEKFSRYCTRNVADLIYVRVLKCRFPRLGIKQAPNEWCDSNEAAIRSNA